MSRFSPFGFIFLFLHEMRKPMQRNRNYGERQDILCNDATFQQSVVTKWTVFKTFHSNTVFINMTTSVTEQEIKEK